MRTPDEPGLVEAAALAAETVDLLVLGAVRDVHTSVAARVPGRRTLPYLLHDGIAGGV